MCEPVIEDEPLVLHRCGVCEALAKNAHRQVKALRDDVKPGKKVIVWLQSGHADAMLIQA